jgi:3-oxoacid CoA-transferase subunit A
MSTFATGDTHGNLIRIKKFIKRFDCTENDTIVILGDVGINYFGQEDERKAKEEYNNFGVTLLCIQGNHEERPYNFPTYKTKIWNGGLVYYEEEFPNLLFAKDGEIYNIDGKKCMPIGGAYSVDKWYQILKTYIYYRYAIEDTLDAE